MNRDDRRPIRVLLADDHGLLRAGLRAILANEPDIEVVGEAADGAEALRLAQELRPDVVLADISMPAPDGIEVARRVRSDLPGTMTLILTMHEDAQMLRDSLAAGAAGYLIKRAAEYELARAIRATAAGQQYIHEDMRQYLARTSARPERFPGGDLSEVDMKVLRLLAQAATMQKVAQALNVSVAEAEHLRNDVMGRLGLRSRVEVVLYIQQFGDTLPPL